MARAEVLVRRHRVAGVAVARGVGGAVAVAAGARGLRARHVGRGLGGADRGRDGLALGLDHALQRVEGFLRAIVGGRERLGHEAQEAGAHEVVDLLGRVLGEVARRAGDGEHHGVRRLVLLGPAQRAQDRVRDVDGRLDRRHLVAGDDVDDVATRHVLAVGDALGDLVGDGAVLVVLVEHRQQAAGHEAQVLEPDHHDLPDLVVAGHGLVEAGADHALRRGHDGGGIDAVGDRPLDEPRDVLLALGEQPAAVRGEAHRDLALQGPRDREDEGLDAVLRDQLGGDDLHVRLSVRFFVVRCWERAGPATSGAVAWEKRRSTHCLGA